MFAYGEADDEIKKNFFILYHTHTLLKLQVTVQERERAAPFNNGEARFLRVPPVHLQVSRELLFVFYCYCWLLTVCSTYLDISNILIIHRLR